MVKSDTLHGLLDLLSLAGLSCFLFSAIYLAGIRPTKLFINLWRLTRTKFNALSSAWPGVGARTRRISLNCAMLLLGIAIGYGWKTHQYALGLKSEKARELEKWKREYGEYQRVYTAWLKQHQELNPGGDQ